MQNKRTHLYDEPLRFLVRLHSDIVKADALINRSKMSLSSTDGIYLSPLDSAIKVTEIDLVSPETGKIFASCSAWFVNGELMSRRHLAIPDMPDELLPSEVFFDSRKMDYMEEGISFLQLTSIFVLPDYQSCGLGSWIIRHVPELLSETYGLSFRYVLVPFSPALFDSEVKKLGRNRAKKENFLKERRRIFSDILTKNGFKADVTNDLPIFFKKF